jgi:hypothetical protein
MRYSVTVTVTVNTESGQYVTSINTPRVDLSFVEMCQIVVAAKELADGIGNK